MASGRVFVCSSCAHAITAWDEGDPYFLDDSGAKQYAYHPDPDRERCIGVDESMLCLSCGEESMRDSRAPADRCANCDGSALVSTWDLEGATCPICRTGAFHDDPTHQIIS